MSLPVSGSLLANARLFELSPDLVEEGKRQGFLHEDKAAAIGRLMAVDGQRDAIKVVANPRGGEAKPWRLVTGMHRLIGARIESIPVFAIEVSGKPEVLADLEASENLHRRPLGPLERAKFTAALVQAAQERIARENGGLSQQKLAIKARWARVKASDQTAQEALAEETTDTCAMIAHVYGWEESVGEALGMSRRSIHNDLQLFRLVIEPFSAMVEALSKHPVVGENGKQLRDIAQVRDEASRKAVIDLLLDDSELSVEDAKVRLGIGLTGGAKAATPVAYQKHYDAITGGWDRLGLTDKRKFLPTLATIIPTEMKRDLRDMLNKELGDTPPAVSGPVPAVAIRASVKPDYIVCLEDGTRHTNLTTRLARLGMTPSEYRQRWSLPLDYPMLAPNYRATREKAWRQRVRAIRLGLRQPEPSHAG